MRWIICYDIHADRRRTKAFKALSGFVRPVQKSVFEGQLTRRRAGQLAERLIHLVDPAVDTLRAYRLCPSCAARTLLVGTAAPVDTFDTPIIL